MAGEQKDLSYYVDLLKEILVLPLDYDENRVMQLEEIIRFSDKNNQRTLGYYARLEFLKRLGGGRMSEKYLVYFPWLLEYAFTEGDEKEIKTVLARYRSVVYKLKTNYGFSRQQVESVLGEMERNYEAQGFPRRMIVDEKLRVMMEFGEMEKAVRLYEELHSFPSIPLSQKKQFLSRCDACDCDFEVAWFVFLGDYEKAWKVAQPVVTGNLKCSTVPRYTFAELLLPLLETGRKEEADDLFVKDIALQNHEWSDPEGQSKLIRYAALTGRTKEAMNIAEEYYPEAATMFDKRDEFLMALAMWVLVCRMEVDGIAKWDFDFREAVMGEKPPGGYNITQLQNFFLEKARRHASRFDERNGTDLFSERILQATRLMKKYFPQKEVE